MAWHNQNKLSGPDSGDVSAVIVLIQLIVTCAIKIFYFECYFIWVIKNVSPFSEQ